MTESPKLLQTSLPGLSGSEHGSECDVKGEVAALHTSSAENKYKSTDNIPGNDEKCSDLTMEDPHCLSSQSHDIDDAENGHNRQVLSSTTASLNHDQMNDTRYKLSNFWFSSSIRGWDNIHIYLWILKDLSWTLDNFMMSAVCGSFAVAWCFVLAGVAYLSDDWEEMYMLIATVLWLGGNFWWMAAETGIYGDDDTNALESSYVLEAGLAWLVLFYLILRPFGFLLASPCVTQQYLALDLKPRFPSYFKNWRQYEYMHMLLWIGKDLSWNREFAPTWIICLLLTTFIGIDFIWISWKKGYAIDVAHYSAQLLWVYGNAAWAYGELFTGYDDVFSIRDANATSVKTGRWWAAVLLVVSFVPIMALYFIWLPYMYFLQFEEDQQQLENDKESMKEADFMVPSGMASGGAAMRNPLTAATTSATATITTTASGTNNTIGESDHHEESSDDDWVSVEGNL